MNRKKRQIQKIYATVLTVLLCGIFVLFAESTDFSKNKQEGCYRIGAVYMTMNNPFYTVIDDEMQLLADSQGDLLLTRDAVMEQERQNQEIYALLEQGIDILIVNPVDSTKVLPALRAAKEQNVPVVVVDAPIADDTLAVCTIASDNYNAGVLCAKDMMRRKDSARILILEHITALSAVDRIQGFLDTIEGNSNYRVVSRCNTNGQLENAMPVTETALKQTGRIDVVMALNDPSALGALGALQDKAMLEETLVYGVDGTPEGKSMIKEGMMTGTAAQFVYRMSESLGDVVYRILEGKTVDKTITIPVVLITAENVENYGTDGWQ